MGVMDNQELWEERHKNVTQRLDKHEEVLDEYGTKIKELEKNDLKREIEYKEIQRAQAELKSLVLENDKRSIDRNANMEKKMDSVLTVILDTFKSNNETRNQTKKYSNEQKWVLIGAVITALCSIAVAIFT